MEPAKEGPEFLLRHFAKVVLDLRPVGANGQSGSERGSPEIGIEFMRASQIRFAVAHKVDVGLGCIGKTIAFDKRE
jgi:hypothetical protein